MQITESGHVDLARVRWFTSSEVGAAISLKSIWRGRDRCRLWLWPQATLSTVGGRALPEEQQTAIMLVCVNGLSYAEAAAELDIPIGTLMSRLCRGRLELARRMSTLG